MLCKCLAYYNGADSAFVQNNKITSNESHEKIKTMPQSAKYTTSLNANAASKADCNQSCELQYENLKGLSAELGVTWLEGKF